MNILVRLKNKAFWMTFIPAVFIGAQLVLECMGVEIDLTEVQHEVLELVNAIFAVLAVLGVAIDPTTAGVADSERAMGYTEPWDDTKGVDE